MYLRKGWYNASKATQPRTAGPLSFDSLAGLRLRLRGLLTTKRRRPVVTVSAQFPSNGPASFVDAWFRRLGLGSLLP